MGGTCRVMVLPAISVCRRMMDRHLFSEAGRLLAQVIEAEPQFSSSYSWLGYGVLITTGLAGIG